MQVFLEIWKTNVLDLIKFRKLQFFSYLPIKKYAYCICSVYMTHTLCTLFDSNARYVFIHNRFRYGCGWVVQMQWCPLNLICINNYSQLNLPQMSLRVLIWVRNILFTVFPVMPICRTMVSGVSYQVEHCSAQNKFFFTNGLSRERGIPTFCYNYNAVC